MADNTYMFTVAEIMIRPVLQRGKLLWCILNRLSSEALSSAYTIVLSKTKHLCEHGNLLFLLLVEKYKRTKNIDIFQTVCNTEEGVRAWRCILL